MCTRPSTAAASLNVGLRWGRWFLLNPLHRDILDHDLAVPDGRVVCVLLGQFRIAAQHNVNRLRAFGETDTIATERAPSAHPAFARRLRDGADASFASADSPQDIECKIHRWAVNAHQAHGKRRS